MIDEVSFIELRLFGHCDVRFRALTGVTQLAFGGVPLLLAGDNFQKPPPASKGWYRELVEGACTNGAQSAVADGPSSVAGRSLTLLKAARRVVLTRLMRADRDQPFIEAQQHMRRPGVGQSFTDKFVAGLRTVRAADLMEDET